MNRSAVLFSTLLLAITGQVRAAIYRAGDISSGDGDSLVMAFTVAGQKACGYLTINTKSLKPPVSSEEFCKAVREVKVTSEERTFLNAVEVDAINTPKARTIVLSQARNKARDLESLKRLAIHEYLAVSGINDSRYVVSGPIADGMSKEKDYFPVRYCEAEIRIQAGYNHKDYDKRAYLTVKYKTEFPSATEASFWFDFHRPSRQWLNEKTHQPLDVLREVRAMDSKEICLPITSRTNQQTASVCMKASGPKDLLGRYVKESEFPKVLVAIKMSQLRSIENVQFISPSDANLNAEFMNANGYFDDLGFRGTKLLFTKRYFNTQMSDSLPTFGAEFFQVTCY